MKRLIEKGLMFGNLVHVSSKALVDRYNRALEHLTGQYTQLADFHIDISGYSPEIGDELGDPLYLNHNGVNRQFILLSTAQKSAPLLNAQFSNTRDILHDFIEANETQLFALTARDAVAGELVNSVFDLSAPARLLDIRKIKIEADTTGGALRHAEDLADKIDRFKTKEDAWFDDVLIAEMISLASKTGDIARNPVRLKHTEFEHRNVWTAHFGGLYVFPDMQHPAVISTGKKEDLKDLPIKYVFDLDDRNQIAKFLDYNDLVEPVIKARGIDGAAVLRQKMEFMIVEVAADLGLDLAGKTRRDLRRMMRRYGSNLPEEFHRLAEVVKWAEEGGRWPKITSDDPAYFYTLRAAETVDHDLVNMLLAQLTPLDIRQTFICHKQLFYARYASWPDEKRAYVVDFLEREYQVDKVGAREALFGREPDMAGDTPEARIDRMIDRVGPWGAIRR